MLSFRARPFTQQQASSRAVGSSRRTAPFYWASSYSNQSSTKPGSLQHLLLSGASAALLGLSLTLTPAPAALAEEYKTIADAVKADFVFVDGNKDGVVTQEELLQLSRQMAEQDKELPPVDPSQVAFTYKLFDLNLDGKLTTEEVLRSIALDGAVSDDDNALDEGVFRLVDRNADGKVDRTEFTATLGDFGADGEGFKGFVFGRVDHMSGSGGQLDVPGFAQALVVVRNAVLGY